MNPISRVISLVVLVLLVILFGALFLQVMIGFLLPMFLALVLTVVFTPMHKAILLRMPRYPRIAAALTTLTILLIVLAPLLGVIAKAGKDAMDLKRRMDVTNADGHVLQQTVDEVNGRLGTELTAAQVEEKFDEFLEPLRAKTPGFLGRFLLGFVVMIISLYYFLLDGHNMIATVLKFLPLHDEYEQRLLNEFNKLSRAVVSATLAAALVQGLVAGFGFWLFGLKSIFLLMLLTMLGSMIPFVGAASVWISCCVWLLISGQTTSALLLAAYGGCIISTVDNLVKPAILHGNASLHPLLALLSVLGGVQALGAIGIFVGPMAVAFLQAGLEMLHAELGFLERPPTPNQPNIAA